MTINVIIGYFGTLKLFKVIFFDQGHVYSAIYHRYNKYKKISPTVIEISLERTTFEVSSMCACLKRVQIGLCYIMLNKYMPGVHFNHRLNTSAKNKGSCPLSHKWNFIVHVKLLFLRTWNTQLMLQYLMRHYRQHNMIDHLSHINCT